MLNSYVVCLQNVFGTINNETDCGGEVTVLRRGRNGLALDQLWVRRKWKPPQKSGQDQLLATNNRRLHSSLFLVTSIIRMCHYQTSHVMSDVSGSPPTSPFRPITSTTNPVGFQHFQVSFSQRNITTTKYCYDYHHLVPLLYELYLLYEHNKYELQIRQLVFITILFFLVNLF